MLLVNGFNATWYKFNTENSDELYDDVNSTDKKIIKQQNIKLCPFPAADGIKFGKYTHPEATGYYVVNGSNKIEPGDQLEIIKRDGSGLQKQKLTVLKVQDYWIFNRAESRMVAVK